MSHDEPVDVPDADRGGEVIPLRPRSTVPAVPDEHLPTVPAPPRFKATIRPPINVVIRVAERARRPSRPVRTCIRYSGYTILGSARLAGRWWRWVVADEHRDNLKLKPELVERVRERRRRASAFTLAGTVLSLAVAWWFWRPAPLMALSAVLVVASIVEHVVRKAQDRERGRDTLGRYPGSKAVRRVFVNAKLAKDIDDVRVVGPVTRLDDIAWTAIVELPPGTPAKLAIKRQPELAAAIGVDLAQLALDLVPGHNGRVAVWCADSDPLAGPAIQSPLASRTTPFDVWTERVSVGVDVRGRSVSFALPERSLLTGGEPGAGKSVGCNNILCAVALDPHARMWMVDGKGGADLMDYEDIADRSLPDPDPEAMLDLVRDAQDDMSDRYRRFRALGEKKLTREIAAELGLRWTLLHVDELQFFIADEKYGKRIVNGLWDLVSRGRAAGWFTSGATQRPGTDVVPSKLRDILSIRWAFRCTTPDASNSILGRGWAKRGYSADTIDATQRGAGLLYAEGGMPVPMRTYLLEDREVTALAKRAYRMREEAGTLPQSDARPGVRLLKAILRAMDDCDRMHTADLLEVLAEHTEYAGWDASRLADELRPLNVAPRQVVIDGRNRNGYVKGEVMRALERA